MNDALVIMNPRTIPECMAAFAQLDLPRIHIVGCTEADIMNGAYDQVMDIAVEKGFEWLWWISDDAVVRQASLDAVRTLASEHPVVTGYSNMAHDDWRVNLCRSPLGAEVVQESYDLYSFHEVMGLPSPVVPTFFAGMCLTGMSTEMWLRYPFRCYVSPDNDGFSSDFHLSKRLEADGVPIVAHRDAFAYHWRFRWQTMPPMTLHEARRIVTDLIPSFDMPRVDLRLP